jgi:acetyl esterase/lipase
MSAHPGIAALRKALAARPADAPLADRRAAFEAMMAADPPPPGTTIEPVGITADLAGELLLAEGAARDQLLVWLHGGQFALGSSASYRGFAARVSAASGLAVLTPDYRLAPEHRFPAAHDDALAALRWAADRSVRLAIGGDSAGASLALAAAQSAPGLARAIWLLSPWVDLTGTAPGIAERAPRDPFVDPALMAAVAARYLGRADPADPRASPLFGPLSGLPPMLVQVGEDEALFDDAARLAARAPHALFQEWAGMIHVWPLFARQLPEGEWAIAQAGLFLRQRMSVA